MTVPELLSLWLSAFTGMYVSGLLMLGYMCGRI